MALGKPISANPCEIYLHSIADGHTMKLLDIFERKVATSLMILWSVLTDKLNLSATSLNEVDSLLANHKKAKIHLSLLIRLKPVSLLE